MRYSYHDIKKFFELADFVMNTPRDGYNYLGSQTLSPLTSKNRFAV
ncbi:MAG: hypothetical protein LBD48_06595 [Treponema sp.]|nr:hypothetical protein [Treponema sp.]